MNAEMILKECAELAEQLKRQIEEDCQVPSGCLGGQMLPVYKEVRERQLANIRKLYNYLLELSASSKE